MKDNNVITGRSKRKITLTSNFALYIVLLIGALIFTQALRSRASNILFSFVFFLPWWMLIYALTARAALKVQMMTASAEIPKKHPYEYKIRLINEWLIPYPFIDAMLYLPERDSVRCSLRTVKVAMSPHADYTVNNTVSFPFRGQYEIGVDCLYVYDFLRMFRIRVDVNVTETVYVLPRRLNMDISRAGAVSDSARTTRKAPNSYEKIEISDIREYRNGDPLKSIHWKLSSKSEDFVVRDYDTGSSHETFVFCDMSAHFPTESPHQSAQLPGELKKKSKRTVPESVAKINTEAVGKAGGNPGSDVNPSGTDEGSLTSAVPGKKQSRKGRRALRAAGKNLTATDVTEPNGEQVDIERLADERYYEDMNEYCADGVVELAVSAVQKELNDGCDCTLVWFDRRAERGVYCFTLHGMADFDAIFRLFATAPLCSAEDDVSRLSGMMKDTQDIKQVYVTAAIDAGSVRRLCAMQSVADGASGAAEVILYNPEERYAYREQRKLYIEGCREQLFSKGLRLVESRPGEGGES
ncbi:MAG: DUF58 domain-containing protein [Eubacteriales bacterium]|nr:DUF58 domain-containing protein [Eubacteriales bacterium]MDY4899107.1 DUF58 domain-containing protein [Eubacteriales bacterium]